MLNNEFQTYFCQHQSQLSHAFANDNDYFEMNNCTGYTKPKKTPLILQTQKIRLIFCKDSAFLSSIFVFVHFFFPFDLLGSGEQVHPNQNPIDLLDSGKEVYPKQNPKGREEVYAN